MTKAGPALVVVTTNAVETESLLAWLVAQLPPEAVAVASGFYAGITALDCQVPAVVIDIGVPEGRQQWQLAELRARRPQATFAVVADAVQVPILAGALRPDVTVTSAAELPPLRELLVIADDELDADQTSWRRTSR